MQQLIGNVLCPTRAAFWICANEYILRRRFVSKDRIYINRYLLINDTVSSQIYNNITALYNFYFCALRKFSTLYEGGTK